jgi:hypothetical protein
MSAIRELRRVIAADAEPRARSLHYTKGQRFLRYDATHELPIVVETEAGKIIARFACEGDCALFVSADRYTLPADFIHHVTRAAEAARGGATGAGTRAESAEGC